MITDKTCFLIYGFDLISHYSSNVKRVKRPFQAMQLHVPLITVTVTQMCPIYNTCTRVTVPGSQNTLNSL